MAIASVGYRVNRPPAPAPPSKATIQRRIRQATRSRISGDRTGASASSVIGGGKRMKHQDLRAPRNRGLARHRACGRDDDGAAREAHQTPAPAHDAGAFPRSPWRPGVFVFPANADPEHGIPPVRMGAMATRPPSCRVFKCDCPVSHLPIVRPLCRRRKRHPIKTPAQCRSDTGPASRKTNSDQGRAYALSPPGCRARGRATPPPARHPRRVSVCAW